MARFTPSPGWTMTVKQDMIRVPPSYLPYVDPAWRETDAHGHQHAGDALAATTLQRYDYWYWCGDCQEMHYHYVGRFCNACGDEVKPGTKVDNFDEIMPGPKSATAVFDMNNGSRETWDVTEAFVSAVTPDMERDAAYALLGGGCHRASTEYST